MRTRCVIEGCGKPAHANGWCTTHYGRSRKYGDPLTVGGIAWGEAQRFLREVVLTHESNECLIWPFAASSGYGRVNFNGSMDYVHRIVCRVVHGEPPTPEHEVAHSCGRGQFGCVAKRHLDWKTHADNLADRLRHGTLIQGEQHVSAKLTAKEVTEIRRLKGRMFQSDIAEQFGVHVMTVSDIFRGKTWRSVA